MKNYSISLLRLFATILIFCSHILTFGIGSYICDSYFPFYFGVNIFLCISAILYANKEIKQGFFKKQFTKILVPVVVYIAVLLIIQLSTRTFDIAVYGNLWYVIAILICYLLLPLLSNIKQNKHKNMSLCVIVSIIIVECVLAIFTPIQICVVCFVLAYFMANIKDKSLVMFFVLLFVMSSFAYYYVPIVTIKHYLCCIMGISFSFAFLGLVNIKAENIKVLDATDSYSYAFYITQQCLMLGSLSLIHITKYLVLNIVIILAVNIVLCFLLKKASDFILKLMRGKR